MHIQGIFSLCRLLCACVISIAQAIGHEKLFHSMQVKVEFELEGISLSTISTKKPIKVDYSFNVTVATGNLCGTRV